jgi:hypothetical protein
MQLSGYPTDEHILYDAKGMNVVMCNDVRFPRKNTFPIIVTVPNNLWIEVHELICTGTNHQIAEKLMNEKDIKWYKIFDDKRPKVVNYRNMSSVNFHLYDYLK